MSIESMNGNSKGKAKGPRSSEKFVSGYNVFEGWVKTDRKLII